MPVGLVVSSIPIPSPDNHKLTVAVGLGGVYWLHLNWGRYFSSPRKIALTIINALIAIIGGTIVSPVRDFDPSRTVLTANSAGWDCMCRAKRFTTTPRTPVLLVPTLAIKTSNLGYLYGVCFLFCFLFPHGIGVFVYNR